MQSAYAIQTEPLLFQREGLKIFEGRAVFNQRTLYSAEKDRKVLVTDEPCSKLIQIVYTPLSLAGDCFAYERAAIETGSAECGPPASHAEIIVIDLYRGESVYLPDLFEKSSIVAAIKNDRWVRALKLPAEKMDSASTVGTLLQIINRHGDDGSGEGFRSNAFTISGYDASKNKVGIRLFKKEYVGFNHYQFLQLGLWVTPNPNFAKELSRPGFFLGKFKGGIISAERN